MQSMNGIRMVVGCAALLAWAMGCNQAVKVGEEPGTGGGSSASASSSSGMSSSASSPGAMSSSSSTGGGPTACSAKIGCGPGEFCLFDDQMCGQGNPVGTCLPKPLDCSIGPKPPTCMCDGTVDTFCPRGFNGVDYSATGTCTKPAGTFACGSIFCEVDVGYCVTLPIGPQHPWVDYFCGLPSACPDKVTCSCALNDVNVCPGATCATSADGQVTITCH